MSWAWIAIAVTVPTLLALILAVPLWLKFDPIVGNAIGAGVIFIGVIALISREYVEIQRQTMRCLELGRVCSFSPEPFTRFGIYGLIGLAEACALFVLSLVVEERRRRRSYDPQWQ